LPHPAARVDRAMRVTLRAARTLHVSGGLRLGDAVSRGGNSLFCGQANVRSENLPAQRVGIRSFASTYRLKTKLRRASGVIGFGSRRKGIRHDMAPGGVLAFRSRVDGGALEKVRQCTN